MKGVQCYEPFGGIALKNHAFFYLIFYFTYETAFTLVHLSVSVCFDIFNVSPFSLMKGTGVPENNVF